MKTQIKPTNKTGQLNLIEALAKMLTENRELKKENASLKNKISWLQPNNSSMWQE